MLHIITCVDTSGSMSDDSLAQVWGELNGMANTGTKITVIEADSDTQNIYEFNKSTTPTFKGRGGTAYQPAITEAKKFNPDAIIYIGDFDSSDTPENPNLPFLWVGINAKGKSTPGDFGKVIHVEDGEK